jgi:hypothetical protein
LMSSTRCRTGLATVTAHILTMPVCAATYDTDERHGTTVFSADTLRALLVYMILLTTVLTAIVAGWLGQRYAGATSRSALRTVAVQTDEAMPTSVFVTRAGERYHASRDCAQQRSRHGVTQYDCCRVCTY